MEHLILQLESPLMAFGGESIDSHSVIRPFPAASMITGLLANALGFDRSEGLRHQQLQERLVFATRIDREPVGLPLQDFQTALLGREKGWTTWGSPEGRRGAYYDTPHLRRRDYHADMKVTIAMRLQPADLVPSLHQVARALREPARPLFIGRKPCLPSEPIYGGTIESEDTLSALLDTPLEYSRELPPLIRVAWPANDGNSYADLSQASSILADERNWATGLHGGGRRVYEASLESGYFKHKVAYVGPHRYQVNETTGELIRVEEE